MDAPLKMQMFGRVCRKIYRWSRLKRLTPEVTVINSCSPNECYTGSFDHRLYSRLFSTSSVIRTVSQTQEAPSNLKLAFRCHDDNPIHHSIDQEGLFYTVPEDQFKKLLNKGIHAEFRKQSKIFAESCIMVRKPALEMINYIKYINLDRPVVRALFYGEKGCGKTMSMSHVLHYCSHDNWLIVNVPWAARWTLSRLNIQVSLSTFKPDRIDLPQDAMEWLIHFRTQNTELLKELKCEKSYTWSKREITDAGSPLIDIVDFGINRNKYACDCVGVLLKEVKRQACEKKIKVLVAIDGVNSLYTKSTIQTDTKQTVLTENISLVRSFRKMLYTNWTNGFVMCSVDANGNHKSRRENYTPNYLLGKEGFEVMDPFIPVLVPKYTDKEIYSCLRYYQDRNWLQHSESKTSEGLQEIIFLSNYNPHTLTRICASR